MLDTTLVRPTLAQKIALGYAGIVYRVLTDETYLPQGTQPTFNQAWEALREIVTNVKLPETLSKELSTFISLVETAEHLGNKVPESIVAAAPIDTVEESPVMVVPEEDDPNVVIQWDDEPEPKKAENNTPPTYAFDVEVFPNFISVIFIDVNNVEAQHSFWVHPDLPDAGKRYATLRKFLDQKMTLVGFNSIGYDEFILKAFLLKWNRHQIFQLSCDIVNDNPERDLTDLRYMEVPWSMLDLQKIMGVFTSLKQIAVNLRWHKIQDLPLPFDAMIETSQVEEIMKYNLNDVQITNALYWAIKDEIDLRAGISDAYGIDVRSQSRSGVANVFIQDAYAKASKKDPKEFKHWRTHRDMLFGRDCIADNIAFTTIPLQELQQDISESALTKPNRDDSYLELKEVYATTLAENGSDSRLDRIETLIGELSTLIFTNKVATTKKVIAEMLLISGDYPLLAATIEKVRLATVYRFKKEIQIGKVVYDIGIGGLHSRDKAEVLLSDDDYELIDADVTSFYPMIMLNNEFAPQHLGVTFSKVFREMVEDRIKAKKQGEKLKADALKITINSMFGKMNFDYFWLYDPKAFFSVTLNGQLYLLMLIERLEAAGIEVVSANTDGVVSRVHKDQKSEYERICKKWEVATDFELEYTAYLSFIRKDVNNYIVVKPDGEIKTKGSLDPEISLSGGYKYPIVKKAIFNYFVHGKPVDDTIAEADNILDFCLAQKVSMTKFAEVIFRKDAKKTQQQATNRYFASSSGGALLKVKHNGDEISLLSDYNVEILNDVDFDRPISEYDINYGFYLEEVQKVIEKIEGSPIVQPSLF